MGKIKFSYIVIFVIYFILLNTSISASEIKKTFTLNTEKYVQHKPITSKVVKVSQNIKKDMLNIDVTPNKIIRSGEYCVQKKRRGFYLQNDENTQNYISVRGGLVLNYINCDNGYNANIKIKRNNIYGFYQIKF